MQNRVLKETFVVDDLNVCLSSFSSLSYRLVDSRDATNPDPGQRDRVAELYSTVVLESLLSSGASLSLTCMTQLL